MSAFHKRNRGFNREEPGVGFAAGFGLVFRQPDERRGIPQVLDQTGDGFIILPLHIAAEALEQRLLL